MWSYHNRFASLFRISTIKGRFADVIGLKFMVLNNFLLDHLGDPNVSLMKNQVTFRYISDLFLTRLSF